jgi:3-oxoacyl-[acyl-carrier-protein] synthase II
MTVACIVGYGLIDGLGSTPAECWENLLNDKDFHRPIDGMFEPYPHPRVNVSTGIWPSYLPQGKDFFRTIQYGMYAAREAIKHANLPPSNNVGVLFSNGTGAYSHSLEYYENDFKKLKPRTGLMFPLDALSSMISMENKFNGVNTSVNSACATGLVTIETAIYFMEKYDYDYVVVGGADSGINKIHMKWFSALRALSNRSMPFDRNRSGFVMGEGAGCIILQSEKKARQMGSKVYARITGIASTSDAFDPTAANGIGARMCLDKLDLSNVDAVNAHGTSTPLGDPIEFEVVREYTNAPIYSNKGKIGHTLSAAGVIETIYSVMSIENGIIPHTANCNDPEFDVVTKNIHTKVNKVLNNSFGFGGKCCSMTIESV